MLKIVKKYKEYEYHFESLKIFSVQNPTKFYRDIFLDSKIYIDNRIYKKDDIVYINQLSKITDFIDLSKNSFLVSKILELITEYPLINNENINNIIQLVNQNIDYNLLDRCDGDNLKIIKLIFDLCEDTYLNKELLKLIIDNCFDESKLIIIDNIDWIDIKFTNQYLNLHQFILIANDFREYITKINEIECVVIVDNDSVFEILDIQRLIGYLENQLNFPIESNDINNFINDKHCLLSMQIMSEIHKLAKN